MARSKKPRSLQTKDEPVLQLTSHQRIVAISAILLWGAFCFVLGIVATNVDQYLKERRESAAEQEEAVEAPGETASPSTMMASKGEKPSAVKPAGEGRVTSPRQGVLDSTRPKPPAGGTTGKLPQRDSSRMVVKAIPEVRLPVEVPAPAPEKRAPEASEAKTSARPASADQEPNTNTTKPKTGSTKSDTTAPGTATAPPQAETKPETTPLEPMEPMEPKEPRKSGPPKQGVEATPVESGASTPKGEFGVQVASFGATNASKAEEHRKQVAADTGLPARLVKSEDGKHLRLLLGAYATKEAAQKARDALRKRKEFADCYVQVLR